MSDSEQSRVVEIAEEGERLRREEGIEIGGRR